MEKEPQQRKKRSQRDYNLGFKLAVVAQVEKGEMTYKQAQKLMVYKVKVLFWCG